MPSELHFTPLIELAAKAARRGARASLDFADMAAHETGDVNVGHHSISTGTDQAAQQAVLEALAAGRIDCNHTSAPLSVLTEEKCKEIPDGIKIVKDAAEWSGIPKSKGALLVVDPTDGSSFRSRGLPEWSTSVGVVLGGEHIGGAIGAPEVSGGLMVIGETKVGTILITDGGRQREKCKIVPRARKKQVICMGLDCSFLPPFSRLTAVLAPQVQTTTSNTCALALAYLAAGRYDAVIQPVQAPWDWAAGYPLVLAAGGAFQFFHYREGKLVFFEKPDALSYDPVKRNTAFIAGHRETVEWVMGLLAANWSD